MVNVPPNQQRSRGWWFIDRQTIPKLPGVKKKGPFTFTIPVDETSDDWERRARQINPNDTFNEQVRKALVYGFGEVGDPERVDVVLPGQDGWSVRICFTPDEDGRPYPSEVRIRCWDQPARDVGSRMMKRLGLGGLKKIAEAAITDQVVAEHFLGARWAKPTKRPGRRGRPVEYYARWAQRYVDACRTSSKPVADLVAEENAKPGVVELVTPASVKAIINKARTVHGLLTDAPEGRAGGELTPKALEVLSKMTVMEGGARDGQR